MIAYVLLLALVFTIPWEKSVLLPGVGTLTKVIGVGAALAALPQFRAYRWNAFSASAAALALWSALTWFWSLDPSSTLARTATYAQLLVLFALVSHERRTRALAWAYIAGSAVASVATMARYGLGLQTYWKRYAAPGFDPNDLGMTVAIAIPLALWLCERGRRTLPALALALIGVAVLLTASRTALLATLAALVLGTLFWRDRRIACALSLAALAAGALWFAPQEARQRIATTTTEITQGTLHNRTTIWKAGLRAWKQRPLFGAGAGAYPDAVRPLIGVPARAGHEYVAHNAFLSVLVETGLAGLALYLLACLVLAVFIWVLPAAQRTAFALALVVWLFAASTLTWEHRKPSWLLPAFVCALWRRSFDEDQDS